MPLPATVSRKLLGETCCNSGARRSLLTIAIAIIALAVTACSSTVPGPDGKPIPAELAAGNCPASIVSVTSRKQWDSSRYGANSSYEQMRNYQKREIANCHDATSSGDIRALRVLESHWNRQQEMARLVGSFQTFLQSGADTRIKRQVAQELHELDSSGRYDFRPNPAEALRYLGMAVGYGENNLRPEYAARLVAAGEYDGAFSQYQQLVANNVGNREARCEHLLQLGYLYFAGAGTPQNSYLGYYYWQRGLDKAADARWGSCIKNNMTDQVRYRRETDRLQYVTPLIDQLSPMEKASIRDATKLSMPQGRRIVAGMDYQPRAGTGITAAGSAAGTAAISAPPMTTPRPSTVGPSTGWPQWTPMRGGICAMQYSNTAINRADLFSRTGNTVWTLVSSNGDKAVLGSAVAVSPSILLTNCHVITDPRAIQLQNPLGKRSASLVAADRENDRCILSSSQPTSQYLGRARPYAQVLVGEDVSAVGSPKGMTNTLSRGIVAGKRERNGHRLIQTDAALSTGSSGGGLFDNRGNLIAITTFRIPEADSLNFAIAIDEYCAP